MRNSFIFYASFWDAIKELPRDVQGEVLTSIIEYGLNGVTTENLKPIAKAMFILIKPQLDANIIRYENGKKGGAPAGNNNAKKTTEKQPKNNLKTTEKQPNENVNENENVNVNHNVNENEEIPPNPHGGNSEILPEVSKFEKTVFEIWNTYSGKRNSFEKDFSNFNKKTANLEIDFEKLKKGAANPENKNIYFQSWLNDVFPKQGKFRIPSLQEVQNYCNERQNGISAYQFVNFYQSKGWKVGNQPMKDWQAAVRTWEQKRNENGKNGTNRRNIENTDHASDHF